jgi:putative ABC transport system permease protein
MNMDWTARVRTAFASATPAPHEEVIEELAQHAKAMYETARADGYAPEEAVRRVDAQLDLWRLDAGSLRHRSRRLPVVAPPPALPSSRLSGLMQDIRYAARLLRRQPRHALLTILTMALGIGATTVLFSVTYGVLMRPLPWPHADRIVVLKETRGGSAPRFGNFTNAAYLAWRDQAATLENIAAWSQRLVTLTGAGEPDRIRITAATATLFDVLGARPLIGSFFAPQDESSPVIVLSERLWRQRFNADPAVLGKPVHLDGEAYTVVGVLPDSLAYPDRQTRAIVPYAIRPAAGNYLSLFNAIAALRPGVTVAQAAAEGTARGRLAADTGMTTTAIFGSNGPIGIAAQPLREALTADVRRPLLVLLIAVGLLLVTATANVASLQLARATTRTREMAIRAALGAGGARVTRQLLVESLLLGIAGGAAGLALTGLLHRSLPTLLPADFPRLHDLGIDAVVLAFALAVSVTTSIGCGLLPAWRARRLNLVEALTDDGTAPVGGGASSPTARARTLIMTGQVAIACVLLIGASLLGRSFMALLTADRGYDPASVLSARLSMPAPMFPVAERRFAIVEQILGRLAATPGVTEAAFTSELPLTPGGSTSSFNLKSPKGDAGVVRVQASPRIVSPRYFHALRIRTIAGRVFSDVDTETSEPVVVVNQAFARRYLGDVPLGSRVPMAAFAPSDGREVESTVIGIVDDARYVTARDVSQPELYYSHRQMRGRLPVQTVTMLSRTSGDPRAAAAALRAVVRGADDRLVADLVVPLEQRLLTTLARPRLYAMLLGGFAAVALLIAVVGLFGLLSYSLSQRSRELAIRAALGAGQADILRLVLRQGLTVTVAGVAGGVVASAWLARVLSTELYGVTPHDTLTFVVVPLLLLFVGVLACLVPARRAARLDPLRALRGN